MAWNRRQLPRNITASLLKRDKRRRMRGGGIPLMETTIARLSLSPCVKALCNIHCACIVNFYLPGSSFDKSVFSPSFRPHSMAQGNLFFFSPLSLFLCVPIILIKVIPFLNKKAHTSKEAFSGVFKGHCFYCFPFILPPCCVLMLWWLLCVYSSHIEMSAAEICNIKECLWIFDI